MAYSSWFHIAIFTIFAIKSWVHTTKGRKMALILFLFEPALAFHNLSQCLDNCVWLLKEKSNTLRRIGVPSDYWTFYIIFFDGHRYIWLASVVRRYVILRDDDNLFVQWHKVLLIDFTYLYLCVCKRNLCCEQQLRSYFCLSILQQKRVRWVLRIYWLKIWKRLD